MISVKSSISDSLSDCGSNMWGWMCTCSIAVSLQLVFSLGKSCYASCLWSLVWVTCKTANHHKAYSCQINMKEVFAKSDHTNWHTTKRIWKELVKYSIYGIFNTTDSVYVYVLLDALSGRGEKHNQRHQVGTLTYSHSQCFTDLGPWPLQRAQYQPQRTRMNTTTTFKL